VVSLASQAPPKSTKPHAGAATASAERGRSASPTAAYARPRTSVPASKRRVSGNHQPPPAVGLLGMAHPRGGPSHTLLEEAKRVLLLEAPRVGPPQEAEVRCGGDPLESVPPQPQSTRGSRRLSPPGSRSTSTRTRASRPRSAWGHDCRGPRGPLDLRVQPCPATHTHPPVSGVLAGVLGGGFAEGSGQLAGSLHSNLRPWRRWRPLGAGGPTGSA
jgi:hypothetical protein